MLLRRGPSHECALMHTAIARSLTIKYNNYQSGLFQNCRVGTRGKEKDPQRKKAMSSREVS